MTIFLYLKRLSFYTLNIFMLFDRIDPFPSVVFHTTTVQLCSASPPPAKLCPPHIISVDGCQTCPAKNKHSQIMSLFELDEPIFTILKKIFVLKLGLKGKKPWLKKISVNLYIYISPVTIHLLLLTCHLSPVPCHLSPVTCHMYPALTTF